MNSGLPYLIDAIFGKKDLASVSLDEMYEVINEFPSFNAAHFLLSKKLGEENDATYEKVSMRTALYFNNPLWLQSILEVENHTGNNQIREQVLNHEPHAVRESIPEIAEPVAPVVEIVPEENNADPLEIPETIFEEKPAPPVAEIVWEEAELNAAPAGVEYVEPEKFSGAVSSFDELISKYKIEIPEPTIETPADTDIEEADVPLASGLPESETVRPETREEILNDYGIFEEEYVRETDHDNEAFDRPLEIKSAAVKEQPAIIPHPEIAEPGISEIEISQDEKENIVENPVPGKSPEKSDDGDYDAFDRPVEDMVHVEKAPETAIFQEELADALEADADDTNAVMSPYDEQVQAMDEQIQELVSRFGEKQKSLPLFDTKKAEAIVFAPYHMIDYFASQGIKLVLEDHPADNLGKQLKSFTDWLKVMKKLPVQAVSEKQNEKESDRIRHFAAHSIEERDILTESMAEVLAKQGMYENAIALFQKLSLIYPPKSAYFASRIEQLKASLP